MTTVPAGPVTVGEVGQDRPAIKHGTFSAYTNGKCRCDRCRRANAEHQRLRSGPGRISSEEAKYCQICGMRLTYHPLKSCWRELR